MARTTQREKVDAILEVAFNDPSLYEQHQQAGRNLARQREVAQAASELAGYADQRAIDRAARELRRARIEEIQRPPPTPPVISVESRVGAQGPVLREVFESYDTALESFDQQLAVIDAAPPGSYVLLKTGDYVDRKRRVPYPVWFWAPPKRAVVFLRWEAKIWSDENHPRVQFLYARQDALNVDQRVTLRRDGTLDFEAEDQLEDTPEDLRLIKIPVCRIQREGLFVNTLLWHDMMQARGSGVPDWVTWPAVLLANAGDETRLNKAYLTFLGQILFSDDELAQACRVGLKHLAAIDVGTQTLNQLDDYLALVVGAPGNTEVFWVGVSGGWIETEPVVSFSHPEAVEAYLEDHQLLPVFSGMGVDSLPSDVSRTWGTDAQPLALDRAHRRLCAASVTVALSTVIGATWPAVTFAALAAIYDVPPHVDPINLFLCPNLPPLELTIDKGQTCLSFKSRAFVRSVCEPNEADKLHLFELVAAPARSHPPYPHDGGYAVEVSGEVDFAHDTYLGALNDLAARVERVRAGQE